MAKNPGQSTFDSRVGLNHTLSGVSARWKKVRQKHSKLQQTFWLQRAGKKPSAERAAALKLPSFK